MALKIMASMIVILSYGICNNYGCLANEVISVKKLLNDLKPDLVGYRVSKSYDDGSNNTYVHVIQNLGLSEFNFTNINDTIVYLKAANNSFEVIGGKLFTKFENLSAIDLRSNKISNIDKDTFSGLTKLQYLYLKGNQLQEIQEGVFDSLVVLKEIWLQNNELRMISNGTFSENLKLVTIYLNDNRLIGIQKGTFLQLKKLEKTDFSGNICFNEGHRASMVNKLVNNDRRFDLKLIIFKEFS
jgi:Leucine-rich repeat (LRR) protein